MRKILTSFSLVAASLAFAQVGINADENDIAKDAVFHVKNKSGEAKGVVLPSVSLDSTTDQASIAGGSVTTGLMVWNDGTRGLSPAGYYYWDGGQWILTGNVGGASPIVSVTHYSANYTLKSTDTVITCDNGATLQVTIPDSQFVEGRNFVALNNNCSGGLIFIDKQGNNVLSGGTVNTGIQEGLGQHLYFDGNRWFNTTGY